MGADVRLDANEILLSGSMQFQGTRKKDRVDGTINGGGKTIRATANHGEITLHIQ